MKIQSIVTIETYEDIDKLANLVEQGEVRIAPMVCDPDVECGEDACNHRYYRFQPEEGQTGVTICATTFKIPDLFVRLSATVSVNKQGNKLTFTPQGLTINGERHIKYKYMASMVYRLQKTQYKGENPYGFLATLIHPLWNHVTANQLTEIGYITAA